MNILKGTITHIKTSGSLSLVEVQVADVFFKTIVIETPSTASYLKYGNQISVIFKETEVAIGKGMVHPVSLQNKVTAEILEIEEGELLSKLTLRTTAGRIVAIITADAVCQLQLLVGERVTAMIKTNEMMLSA